MKKLTILCMIFMAASSLAFGQAALSSTTLGAAVSDSATTSINLASLTGVTANNTMLYVDREAMFVNAVPSTGTVVSVTRGYFGTRAVPHSNAATVYLGSPTYFNAFPRFGNCTRANEIVLPQIDVNIRDGMYAGSIVDCFGSLFQYDLNVPMYKLTVAPNAQPSGTAPVTGANSSITAQAGGASTAAATAGANGGTMTVASGAGGAGASTGTAGNGGALSVTAGAGAAAAGSGATGGNGGAIAITAGASGGSVTSGNGGAVTITAGASANGSTAAGNGGNVSLKGGAVGTGGTGAAGSVRILDAVDATKIAALDASGISTGTTRTYKLPDASAGIPVVYSCGATGSGNQTCSPAAANAKTQIFNGSSTLASNAAVITFPTAFTSTSSFFCVANDITTRANPVQMIPASASTATITNTTGASDVVQWVCIGN